MRILLLSEIFPPKTGGSGRWFWEMYRRLPREWVAIAAGDDPAAEAFDRSHDTPLHRVPLTMNEWGVVSLSGSLGYLRALRRLRTLVREEQVTSVHSGRCLPEGVMARALKSLCGVPYVCYVHGDDVRSASLSRELSWLVRWVFSGAEYLVANCNNTAKILVDEWGQPPTHLAVLHPGVDTRRFAPARRDPAVRERLGWGERRVILTVGRFQTRKGQDRMILALASIRDAIPDVLFVIVGDGETRSQLEGLVADQEVEAHVQFLGELPDEELIQCYQQCDLFALPNRQVGTDIEGFGMVLLEAQACGRPVLAGASGGTSETLREGATGVLVECSDPSTLAAGVVDLLIDPERMDRMGEEARRWAVDQFDWEALTEQAMELFDGGTARSR